MTSPDTVGLVTGFTQIFSSELPVLLIKKIVSHVSPGLKFIISLKIIAKKLFSTELLWEIFCCATSHDYNSKRGLVT